MEFTTKVIICIIITTIITITCIMTGVFDSHPKESEPIYAQDDHNYEQTPYVIVTTSPPPATPTPTPTPLYYQKLKNPDNPCSEDYTIFYTNCMGAIKKCDEYCAYWNYEYRKNCKFAQW